MDEREQSELALRRQRGFGLVEEVQAIAAEPMLGERKE
jgi:hypothetical protein